jgi:hypothetical protein
LCTDVRGQATASGGPGARRRHADAEGGRGRTRRRRAAGPSKRYAVPRERPARRTLPAVGNFFADREAAAAGGTHANLPGRTWFGATASRAVAACALPPVPVEPALEPPAPVSPPPPPVPDVAPPLPPVPVEPSVPPSLFEEELLHASTENIAANTTALTQRKWRTGVALIWRIIALPMGGDSRPRDETGTSGHEGLTPEPRAIRCASRDPSVADSKP